MICLFPRAQEATGLTLPNNLKPAALQFLQKLPERLRWSLKWKPGVGLPGQHRRAGAAAGGHGVRPEGSGAAATAVPASREFVCTSCVVRDMSRLWQNTARSLVWFLSPLRVLCLLHT